MSRDAARRGPAGRAGWPAARPRRRLYEDTIDEFVVLVLDRHGLVDRFSLDSADWAETSPLGRFRLLGRSLYRLGSTPAGAFVDRYDLEVR